MRYQIVDIDVTRPLPPLKLEAGVGLALLLRRADRPIAFVMETELVPLNDREAILRCISQVAAEKLLQEDLRTQLAPLIPASPLHLSVAICTKDRPADLAICLEHLEAVRERAGGVGAFEILVVDNAPSDTRTRELVARQAAVRYTCEPKPGLDFARNRALSEATGEFLAYIDDDVCVDYGWFAGLEEALAENPEAAAVTGLVMPRELATEAQVLFERRGGFRRGFEKIYYAGTTNANSLYPCGAGIFGAGCNMAFRREVLLGLGGFDEALDTGAPLPGGGDLDMFYRVIRAGYPLVYEPRFMVFHRHRREYAKLRRQYWTWGLGFMAFVDKSYRHDPTMRPRLRRMVGWWFKDQLRQLRSSLRGRHVLGPDMILAELWGGVVGILGEYSRSLRRSERIRRQFSS